jgi:hypothetical protein
LDKCVSGRRELRFEASPDALQNLYLIKPSGLLVGVGDVSREVSEHYSLGGWVIPHAGAQADVLPLVGDPYSQQFERFWISLCLIRN